MRALAYLGNDRVGLVEAPTPVPGPNDAVVRATASSVCTSDVHMVDGARTLPAGRILGHESVGIVSAVGSAVTTISVGDRVLVGAITPCGRCPWCQRGQSSQCGGDHGRTRFVSRRDGALAEYFLVNDADYNAARIPDEVTDEQAVYAADMLPTGMAAAQAAAIPIGGSVLIVGQGPVGLCATSFARLTGAGLVVTADPDPARRALSRRMGADAVLDPLEAPVHEQVRAMVADGFDSAIDAAGLSHSPATCARSVRRGGTLSNVALHAGREDLTLPLDAITFGIGDMTLRMPLAPGGSEVLGRILRLIAAGRLDPTPLTSHRFAFDDAPKAFELMRTKSDAVVKPLITY